MSKQIFTHLILTRFNVPSPGKEAAIRGKKDWLNDRFKLFENYCLPSIQEQSKKDFRWIIYFDDQTPQEFKDRVANYDCPQMRPVYVDRWHTDVIRAAINTELAKSDAKYLLTSRLDNDDGLNRDFVKTLQKEVNLDRTGFYIFPNGLTFTGQYAYCHRDPSNAFAAYLEPIKDYETVWSKPHHEIGSTSDTNLIDLEYAWLQVIHESNVSNRVRGHLLQSSSWQPHYPYLNLTTTPVNFWKVMTDNLLSRPIRLTRDKAVSILKPILKPILKR